MAPVTVLSTAAMGLTPVERRDLLRVTFPEDADGTMSEMMQFIKMCFEPIPPGERPIEL